MPITPTITAVLLISCCGVFPQLSVFLTQLAVFLKFVYHLAAVIAQPWRLCELGL